MKSFEEMTAQASPHYESVLLNELCKRLLAVDSAGAVDIRWPVQFICRIESVDNLVDRAVAVDPGNAHYRLPLETRLVSPLDGPASGLWRVFGVLQNRHEPAVEVYIASFVGDADYKMYVSALGIRRRLLFATGLGP